MPDSQVLGDEGAGWSVAMSTAGSERGLSLRSPARYTEAAARLVELFDQHGRPDTTRPTPSPGPTSTPRPTGSTPTGPRPRWRAGTRVGPEASCNKIFWSETDVAIHDTALTLLGPEAELLEAGSPGEWLDGYLFALAGPIYAGTNEIQRNVVAERLLGLPAGLTMDFAFDEQQDELRQTVRQALGPRVPGRRAARVLRGRPRTAKPPWRRPGGPCCAALGAPGLLVPEAADGLGLSDVDLVGVLEEAGWAALPEPLLETAALAAPMLAALLPAPSAAAALAALLTEDAPLAVGGIDVGVAGPSSPTTVSADGMLRTPRVVGARDAGVYLLACPRSRLGLAAARRPGRGLHRRTPPPRSTRRATCPPCSGRSRRTPCWPTAWPPRPASASWPIAARPARPPTSSGWPIA